MNRGRYLYNVISMKNNHINIVHASDNCAINTEWKPILTSIIIFVNIINIYYTSIVRIISHKQQVMLWCITQHDYFAINLIWIFSTCLKYWKIDSYIQSIGKCYVEWKTIKDIDMSFLLRCNRSMFIINFIERSNIEFIQRMSIMKTVKRCIHNCSVLTRDSL